MERWIFCCMPRRMLVAGRAPCLSTPPSSPVTFEKSKERRMESKGTTAHPVPESPSSSRPSSRPAREKERRNRNGGPAHLRTATREWRRSRAAPMRAAGITRRHRRRSPLLRRHAAKRRPVARGAPPYRLPSSRPTPAEPPALPRPSRFRKIPRSKNGKWGSPRLSFSRSRRKEGDSPFLSFLPIFALASAASCSSIFFSRCCSLREWQNDSKKK